MALYGALAGCVPPDVPETPPITETRWLEQNWSDAERRRYHHTSQGTSTLPVPYDWFMALEQPRFWFSGEPPLMSDTAYLARFGFIPQDDPTAGTAGGLPVGFALTSNKEDPIKGKLLPKQIGFTCAACHTGQLEYRGTSLRIDGAPSMVDLGKFRETLGVALGYTSSIPGRFDRFADRVLKDDLADKAARKAVLWNEFKETLADLKKQKDDTAELDALAVEEGFGRLDALNRIGNRVFYTNLRDREDFEAFRNNYATTDAPVSFPPLWDTPWFEWVQYDASIMQPMVRNAGQALGLGARVNFVTPGDKLFASLVDVEQIDWMERQLAGDNHPTAARAGFKGLRAPVWPADVLGPIDQAKREQGRALYETHCEGCHLPAVDDPAFWADEYWTAPGEDGQRYLKLERIDLEKIGTDPAQAKILKERKIKLPVDLGLAPGTLCNRNDPKVVDEASFGKALAAITEKVINASYDALGIADEAARQAMNGNRPNCLYDREPGYKARPLDGIWATPPYLHNGSVPSLYALLSPVEERPERFCVGRRAFDPVHVGYDTSIGLFGICDIGLSKFDTRRAGNLNIGHEFADKPEGNGVIGPELSKDERFALIEFLKSTPGK